MSRQVDLSKKLSQADRDYLEMRGRTHLIIQNDRMFGPDAAPQHPDSDDEWAEEVAELTVDELKDELSNRGLSTSGNKAELQKRLISAGPDED